MQIKGKYSWVKHLDFMIVDLISLFISFLISYYLKFHALNFGTNDEWTRYLFIVLILSIVINFFVNPYSGIMRRSYYMELVRAFQLTIYNLLIASLIFYAFGEPFVVFLMVISILVNYVLGLTMQLKHTARI